jgi:ABC-type multidrug transport system ATPase subunit
MNSNHAPDFVPFPEKPIKIGRSSDCDVRLLDKAVSKQHAILRPTDQGIVLEDLDSTFGTFVNGTRIKQKIVSNNDSLSFGPKIVFCVGSDGLYLETERGMSLSVDRVSIAAGTKILVRNTSFEILPNQMVGIIGPSGTGKSTLLNCLASYYPPDSGRLIYDGSIEAATDLDNYRQNLAYVPQQDKVFDLLTLQENLYFAAKLRIGESEPESSLQQSVQEALRALELSPHAETRAGRVSGGQCKRLSVAYELLTRPRLLLLDEPTSGLDPASEMAMMVHFRKLTKRGTTVLCTTHLLNNLHLFDRLIVLGLDKDDSGSSTGTLAYFGPPDGLFEHFGVKTHSDLFDRLSRGDFPPFIQEYNTQSLQDKSSNRSIKPVESAQPSRTGSLKKSPVWGDLVENDFDPKKLKQVGWLSWRSILLMSRDFGLVSMIIAQPLLLGMLVCITQFYETEISPLAFLSVVVAIWLGMNNSARDLVRERALYVRERLRGLRPESYLLSKTVVFLFVGVLQIILLLAVIRAGQSFVFSETLAAKISFIRFFTVLLLCYLGGLMIGFFISTVVRTEEAAVAALPLLIMPQLLLSALATGEAKQSYSQPRPFKPLVVYLSSNEDVSTSNKTGARLAAKTVEGLSLLCLSRPATLLLESPSVKDYSPRTLWLGDLMHLIVLVLGSVGATVLAFLSFESHWPRLIGLG